MDVTPLESECSTLSMDEEDYDYFNEIARSSYADMLHDKERNQLYYRAIEKAVKLIKARGDPVIALDIGTGTGLLSMMAAKCGADKITAIEMFSPMAKVARRIVQQNDFNNITIINKHSTEVTFGPDGDIKEKANILITELFDTELIGEGALVAYHHAHENFMQKDCIAVPHSAITYAQIIASDMMNAWYKLKPIQLQTQSGIKTEVKPDPKMLECPGVPAVHDIQLSQVKQSEFKQLSAPFKVFEFPWSDPDLKPEYRESNIECEIVADGIAQIIISWWDLIMDTEGEIILSTAPQTDVKGTMPWRDHWIQSVYALPREIPVTNGSKMFVKCSHDAYSLWFSASKSRDMTISSSRPWCTYPAKMLWSRPRMGMLNDTHLHKIYQDSINELDSISTVLCIGDMSLLPLIAGKLCHNARIYSCESNEIGCMSLTQLCRVNNLNNVQMLDIDPEKFFHEDKIELLITEPFFSQSVLPWDDLKFWKIRSVLQNKISSSSAILPSNGVLKLTAVAFKDLWKIRTPVKIVEGFDVSEMDTLICNALDVKESYQCEPHALWEYPSVSMSNPQVIFKFNFSEIMPEHTLIKKRNFKLYKTKGHACNAIVFWMEYNFGNDNIYSTGLLYKKQWNRHHKQAVFFVKEPTHADTCEFEIKLDLNTLQLYPKFTFTNS